MIGLDSDVIIDYLRGKEKAVEIVNIYCDELVTTEINVFEIFFGIYRNKSFSELEFNSAKSFFSTIEVFPFTQGINSAKLLSDLYSRGEAVDQNDVLIASTLISKGCNGIISNNLKHFSRFKGLKVITY